MARPPKEPEPGDTEVGAIHNRGGCIYPKDLPTDAWSGLTWWQNTLKFVNDDAASMHGCVRVASVFTSESGEWRLGGLDLLSSMKEDDAVIYVSDDAGRATKHTWLRKGRHMLA